MNTLNYKYHLKVNIDAAWNLWSNFQEIDRFSPAKITGGTNTDEIGAVRIYEIDGSVFVERLENKEDINKKIVISSLNLPFPVHGLSTETKLIPEKDGCILQFFLNFNKTDLTDDATNHILNGICDVQAKYLEEACIRLDQGINIFPEKAKPLEINKLAPNFTLKDQNSKEHNLNSYQGKWILLAFYYSDETFA